MMKYQNEHKTGNDSVAQNLMDSFTPLCISTTTVTTKFPNFVNIIDVAKYIQIDDFIIGIKLVYCGGSNCIVRGVFKHSIKKKDFFNQVTFTLRLPLSLLKNRNAHVLYGNHSSFLISCKLFHNGTIHLTGSHTVEEARIASNMLAERLHKLNGIKMIRLKDALFLQSYDDLIFNTNGGIIGWMQQKDGTINLNNEYVAFDSITADLHDENAVDSHDENVSAKNIFNVFVSCKWVGNSKNIYDFNGNLIGKRVLKFNTNISKRHFEVMYGCVYANGKIVGKEVLEMKSDYLETLKGCFKDTKYLLENNAVVHCYKSFHKQNDQIVFADDDFNVHMINTFFKSPFKISRRRLHKCLIDKGYYSVFDPSTPVNVRFHYHPLTINDPELRGKCFASHSCQCKDISISIFNTGLMNLTGLATIEQGVIICDFMKNFLVRNKDEILAVNDEF